MRRLIGIVFAGLLLTTAVAAKADTFNFTFASNDGVVAATGTLTGDLVGGVYDITSGTIDVTGIGPVTGIGSIVANPNFPNTSTASNLGSGGVDYIYDDVLMPGLNPQIDGSGLLFAVGGTGINLWGDGTDAYTAFSNWSDDRDHLNEHVTFAATLDPAASPEPSGLILLGTGFLGLVGVMRRRLQ